METTRTVTYATGGENPGGCGAAEQDLFDARQQLQTIFDTMQAGIILVNPQGIITFANQRMADMFGCSLDELIGSRYPDHVHPDQRTTGDERMRRLIAGEINHVHHERHYIRRDGSDFWGHLSGRRQEDSEGNLVSLVGVISDISEVKKAQQAIQESEERYRTIIESMQDVYYRADTEGKLVMVSPSGAEMLGYDNVSQILGCSIRDTFYYEPEERDAFLHNLKLKGKISGYELTLKSRDGSPVAVSVSSHLLFSADGSFVGVEGVYHDIRRFKEAMALLKASEDKFSRAFNHAPVMMTISEMDSGRCLEVNDRFCEATGFSREEVIGHSLLELGCLSPAERERMNAVFQRDGRLSDMEITMSARDGRQLFCLVSVERITIADEDRLLSIILDITARKQAENALQESELKFRTLFATLQDAIYLTRADDGLIVECSDRLSGYTRDELLGSSTMALNLWADPVQRQQVVDLVRANGFVNDFEAGFRRKDGTVFSGSISTNVLSLHNGTFLLSVIRDMTERKRIETEIKASEERFRSIMALSPDIISIINKNGNLVYNSPSALHIHGYTQDEMIGLNTFDLIHPDDQETVGSTFNDVLSNPKKVLTTQYRYRNKDGSYAWMECSACNHLDNPLINGIIAISRNIDGRKKMEHERLDLERQLLYAQKLESLGVLAGGIAHDFNNILMTIVGNADMAIMRLSKESPVMDNLLNIEQAAARAADLAKQMLAYSGKGKFMVEHIDLNRLLEEMLQMLKVSISKKAVLSFNPAKPLPAVVADATQMRQVIMNLVINASEAIGDTSGVIDIRTGCMTYDRDYLHEAWLDENLPEGQYVFLEITDNGCGMTPETLGKLFDPFFTTKFTGRGLGMAAVLGIVRGHHGSIKVFSRPKAGTTFTVLLPASGTPAELPAGEACDDNRKATGTVLLVDDEETVRDIGTEMLKELGFTVITANDGRDAVAVFRQNPGVCLIILDLTMPHMDGEHCFRELRQINPDIPVIMSSGYNEQEITDKFIGRELDGFIQKPYRLHTLRETIMTILDRKAEQ